MSRIVRKFRDVSMLFPNHPVTNDVGTKTDVSAVKQSIKNLVLTMNYDRPFHPEIGCQVYGLLFEHMDVITTEIAKQTIINVIVTYEPRATLHDVVIEESSQRNGVDISIFFSVLNNDRVENISIFINRLR
jgi:phage baseplate assembly protein W